MATTVRPRISPHIVLLSDGDVQLRLPAEDLRDVLRGDADSKVAFFKGMAKQLLHAEADQVLKVVGRA